MNLGLDAVSVRWCVYKSLDYCLENVYAYVLVAECGVNV